MKADLGDGLIYREAFTTSAAEQVLDHLVNACGLKLAPEADRGSGANHRAERRSALPEALEPGKIVFVYRRGAVKSDQAVPAARLHMAA